MIYSPERFCFVHIPRTGGNSIYNAVATACAGKDIDLILSTTDNVNTPPRPPMLWCKRHSRASLMKRIFPDWDNIYRFSVVRPVEDIIESQIIYALKQRKRYQRGTYKGTRNPNWVKLMEGDFDPRPWVENQWKLWGDPVEFYCKGKEGEDLGVDLIPFNELRERWESITNRCSIPYYPLPHLNRGV